jgi:hypothetical protein
VRVWRIKPYTLGYVDAVNITEQAWKYVNAMRSHADDKGWLGPADNPKDGNTYWGRSNVMLSFAMFAEVGEHLVCSLIRPACTCQQHIHYSIHLALHGRAFVFV